ncbi:SDR family oxidoreductase [Propioniciclava soli]|uniref:SDR family oxidoreductase n=1 Tax=Propioniciclava soli TaxID=2775081 RepID=UPI003CC837BE
MPRAARPDELAAVIAFCASPEASYLTGTDILCDGGVAAGRGRRGSGAQHSARSRCREEVSPRPLGDCALAG